MRQLIFVAEVTIVPSKLWHTPDKPEETSLIGNVPLTMSWTEEASPLF
jgi:hypothetical protein